MLSARQVQKPFKAGFLKLDDVSTHGSGPLGKSLFITRRLGTEQSNLRTCLTHNGPETMLADMYKALWAKPERVHNYIADTWTYVITVYKSLTTTVCPVKQTIYIIWPKTLQKYSSSCHNIMHMSYSTVQYTLKWPGCLQHNVWHNLWVNFKFYKALSKRSSRSSSSSLPARIKLYHTQFT